VIRGRENPRSGDGIVSGEEVELVVVYLSSRVKALSIKQCCVFNVSYRVCFIPGAGYPLICF
jgi:hypothetical protein